MNLGLLSLILLLAAIVIGFLRNANVGVVCIGFAMILTLLYGDQITAKSVIAGFSTSLFILPDEVPKERKYLLFVFQIIRVQIRKTIELDFL